MFQAILPTAWTVSDDDKVTQSETTDFSQDGSSTRLDFENAENEYAECVIPEVDLSAWEEITAYIYISKRLNSSLKFLRITINGQDFDVDRPVRADWKQALINTRNLGTATTIRFTSLVPDQVVWIDLMGVRKYDEESLDKDIANAFKERISLDYKVATTLSEDVEAGAQSLSLSSKAYIFNSTRLKLTEDATEETVDLLNAEGELLAPLENAFTAAGTIVTALCPTLTEEFDGIEPDPVCGINITQIATGAHRRTIVDTIGGSKIKRFLGETTVQVYVDCQSKLKVLAMARQFQKLSGDKFAITLDGEIFDVYLDSELFLDQTDAGNNPRHSWFYKVQPSPVTVETILPVTDAQLLISSEVAG